VRAIFQLLQPRSFPSIVLVSPLHRVSIEDEHISFALILTRTAVGMEAVAAFGLAANVLQVVDFAQKLLSADHQIYQAGSTVEHDEIEVAVKDFTVLNKRLKTWARPDASALGPLTEDGQVRSFGQLSCGSAQLGCAEPGKPSPQKRNDCTGAAGDPHSSTC
jgi:hypothetical protein